MISDEQTQGKERVKKV